MQEGCFGHIFRKAQPFELAGCAGLTESIEFRDTRSNRQGDHGDYQRSPMWCTVHSTACITTGERHG